MAQRELAADPPNPDTRVNPLSGALLRYRILAYCVGTGLIVLVFIGMPIQYWGHSKSVVEIVGPIHGFLYIIYLAFALDLWRRSRWNIVQLVAVVGAGLVPFLAFIVERHMTHKLVPRKTRATSQ